MINRHKFQQIAKQFRAGQLSLNDFTQNVFDPAEKNPAAHQSNSDKTAARLPHRSDTAHKGDCGRVLMIGGSATMPGAISLSAVAALRSGAGLVATACPQEAWPVVASYNPCVMCSAIESIDGMFAATGTESLLTKCQWADAVAIGPGMGCSQGCSAVTNSIYAEVTCPVVVDADALNNLADSAADLGNKAGPRVITPHEGEFARLTGSKFDSRSAMVSHAVELAAKSQIVVVLKGPGTVVTDGKRVSHNQTGNSALATAGTGDVLTGVIASLLGQGMDCFEAAVSGSHLHGLASDLFAKDQSAASLLATDLIEFIPDAMTAITRPSTANSR